MSEIMTKLNIDVLQHRIHQNSFLLHNVVGICNWGIISIDGWRASCQIRKIAGCACAGNAGNVSPPPRFSDPDMRHGTCVSYVSWYMPESLTSGFLGIRWRGKLSRHSRRMRIPQFYVPMTSNVESFIIPKHHDHGMGYILAEHNIKITHK